MLKPRGVICVKENLSSDGFLVDRQDSSLTRSDVHFKQVFQRAGCALLLEQAQQNFPKELFKVKMYRAPTRPCPAHFSISLQVRAEMTRVKRNEFVCCGNAR